MRVIKVYGSLAKFLGKRTFKAAVNTPAEAVRFLVANFPQLRTHMAEQYYKVSLGKADLEIKDHPEQLHYPAGTTEEIRIIPVPTGAKSSFLQILAGVALIALTVVTGGFGGAAIGLLGAAAPLSVGAIGIAIGASLVLGGVAQLLTPTPGVGKDQNDPRKSYSFSGIQNISRQGVPVPIVYGETLVGSVVISVGINTEEV
jgi:hypothetical protein